jgi:hypothetical protein
MFELDNLKTTNVDYDCDLDHARLKNGRGGHNKKCLSMKRDSFKKLLMKVNTKNSEKIFDYLIAFEKQVIKYMRYQRESEHYQRIEQFAETNSSLAVVVTMAQPTPSDVIVSIGPNKNSKCVYFYHLSSYDEPPYSFYKYGYSIGDIEKRDTAHRRAFGDDIVLKHIEVSANPKDLELDFKRYVQQNKSLVSLIDRNNETQTEIVKSDKPAEFWIAAIKKLEDNNTNNNNSESEKLKEKSKEQEHEYKMKELDIELKKQEIQLELRKIELEHEYRMKQLECADKK